MTAGVASATSAPPALGTMPPPEGPTVGRRLGVGAPSVAFRVLLQGGEVVRSREAGAPARAAPAPSHRAMHGAVHASPAAPCDDPRADRPGKHASSADDDPLDPLHRRRAALAPPDAALQALVPLSSSSFVPGAAPNAPAPASLEELLPALVRRIAWSGDGRRGTVRIELGAGELTGGVLVVHADGGRVRVELDVPSGVDASQWQARLEAGLASRGIPTDGVEVK